MNISNDVYGAKASIAIIFDGGIDELASRISNALHIKKISIREEEYTPYEKSGSAEALGWEVWLKQIDGTASNRYEFRIETEGTFEEVFQGRVYDLSPWLARHVSRIVNVHATPLTSRSSNE